MESEISNATLRALRRILRATENGNRRLAAATGLTPSQLLVLREIDASSATTPGQIAQHLQFGHATITAIVDRLVALDLVTRTRGERDRRQVMLRVTTEGVRRMADAPDMLQQIFTDRFAALPTREQAMILAGAERLAIILGAEKLDAAPLLDTGLIDRSEVDQR